MATVSPAHSSSLVTTIQWIRRIKGQEYRPSAGGAPSFFPPTDLIHYLSRLATIIEADGSLSGRNPHAERFAICLAHNGRLSDAFHLFQAIVLDNSQILFLNKKPTRQCSEAVADKPGKLGYEGLYRFGLLALKMRKKRLAKRLFLEIVDKTPTECFPIRLQDIRIESLELLSKLGVKKLASRRLVIDEHKAAKSHQY
ncbi:hypothetical protein IPH92_00650 [Candidatus Kaiserbacteria bacterium]|nr:MAG: hypothetical protein IPH92_00650 [Candidatus Kaiserbacteria bacterium]